MRYDKPGWFDAFDNMFGDYDSRLKRHKVRELYGTPNPAILDPQVWEPIFCFNCGAPGGHVTKNTPIQYVCQPCHQKLGPLPLPMVPGTEGL